MFEIRKTDNYAQWLDGLLDIRGRARVKSGSSALQQGIRGMLGLLGRVFPSYESIMVPVTGCISKRPGVQ
jgi:hypothetical protein